jgi:plasmid stabilization system protein ParE
VNISFSPEAEADFERMVGHLAERNRIAATELGRRVFSVIDKLARHEFDGPEETLRTGEVVRSWPVPPIRIYYQRRVEALRIVRLYHQAQAPIVR